VKELPDLEVVRIAAGDYVVGPAPDDRDWPDEVEFVGTICGDLEVMIYPVTQRLWRSVMGQDPFELWFPEAGDRHPVEGINWFEALAFANALSRTQGVPDEGLAYALGSEFDSPGGPLEYFCTPSRRSGGSGWRLPTEFEWEVACRAGTRSPWFWGSDESDARNSCWFDGNSERRTHEVGQKRPNPWGLYDMAGLVWEWCEDNYVVPICETAPQRIGGFGQKIVRGGSFMHEASMLRSSCRGAATAGRRNPFLGFRLVRTVSRGS